MLMDKCQKADDICELYKFMDCIFCKIIEGTIPSQKVWEDENFFAFLDIRPLQKGHLLIVPKIHVEEIFDLPEDLYTKLFLAGNKLKKPLQQAVHSKKVGFIVEGFGVPHAHLHLIPINNPHELDPNKAHSVNKEELEKVQLQIKDILEK